MIIMLASLYTIKNSKNKLSAIPQTVRAQTRTLQSTLVGKKKYLHEKSDLIKILWSTNIWCEVIFGARQCARRLRNLSERYFSNLDDMKSIWI